MTELKMKEIQIIHWFGCPNLNCTRERIHLAAMLDYYRIVCEN